MKINKVILDYTKNRWRNLYGGEGMTCVICHMISSEKVNYGGECHGFQLKYRNSNGVDFYVEPGINMFSDG